MTVRKYKELQQKYYLGLDMGTSSLGWAITDERYHLLRAKGKDMWGVRLFNEANTAAERRTKRTSRRRLQREKARIGYLKEVFSEEINLIDPGFYQRLDDSKYFKEDKKVSQPFALFADNGYTDKEYYQEYPTIFHLRKALLDLDNEKKKFDVRLVYLAILNMFKNRGHFLNTNLDEKSGGSLDSYITELYVQVEKLEILNNNLKSVDVKEIENILSDKSLSNTARMEDILNLFELSKTKNKQETEIFKLICGLKGKIANIFGVENFDEDFRKFSISFRDSGYDENIIQVEDKLEEEQFEFIILLKQIHDWAVLENIMSGEEYLSVSRVKSYEKHQKDLKVLKKYFKDNSMKEYNKMFRQMEDNNYSAYVGSVLYKDNSIRRGAKGKQEDFYKNIKSIIKNWKPCEEKFYIENEIDKGTFLPKQLTASNGVIPNQVHVKELKRILENASEYLPFLNEKDERELTVKEKIVEVFKFQIPYFVGPINYKIGEENAKHRHNMWSVRKEKGHIYPWNFEEKIDVIKSSEKFIENLINHCTYLNDEKVLPKNSLLYEKFMVLNELNNLKVNQEKIDVQLKQNIYNDLFKKGKKVSRKMIEQYLKNNGYVDNDSEVEISGIDGDFTNKLANYRKFLDIFETDELSYEQEKIAEDIIYYSTIYGDSRSFLHDRIKEKYEGKLTEKQFKRVLGMKFKDWGNLSRELFEIEGIDKNTGEVSSLISKMWNDNYNFMELVGSDKFSYGSEIAKKAKRIEKTLSTIEYEDLDELYISAPVRRMVWQTILVLKEIQEIMGYAPERIFVEMTRSVGEQGERKQSRKAKFLELYKACRKEERNWKDELENTEESKFRSKKLYLYYTQKGRCMYSGENIDLKDLFNDNLYDIDHIYPRHFVKDDSIENNLVLVKKQINSHKSDSYPLENEIRRDRHIMWKILRDGNFITEEKYKRLTRNYEFTDEEKANFINRQIVETGQGTKIIAGLFAETFPNTDVVYVKAGNVSDFRHKFKLVKCRNVNDFHHANDAYLNIVVGNVYFTKFTRSAINFIKDYKRDPEKYKYHMDNLYRYPVSRGGVDAWITKGGESLKTVKSMMARNTPIVTRMNFEARGGIAKQNAISAKIVQKGEKTAYIGMKTSDERIADVCKYGGLTKITGSYFVLVEYTKKNKQVRSIEPMPLYLKEQLKTKEQLEAYMEEQYGYDNPKIRMDKIKMYSLIKVNGFYMYLTGRTGKQLFVSNGVQLVLSSENTEYVRIISKAYEQSVYDEEKISENANIKLYDVLLDKHLNNIYSKRPNPVGEKLLKGRENFINLSSEEQIYVLLQIIQLTQLSNQGANLSKIGGSSKTGVSLLSKEISGFDEFKLINQSVTGLYQNEIDLLTV